MKRFWAGTLAILLILAMFAGGTLAESVDLLDVTDELPTDMGDSLDVSDNVDEVVEEEDEFVLGEREDDGTLYLGDDDSGAPVSNEVEYVAELDDGTGDSDESAEGELIGDDYLYDDLSAGDYEQSVLASQPCSVTNGAHVPVIDPGVEPTYDSEGLTEGSHCANCGAVLVPQSVIPKRQYWVITFPVSGKYRSVSMNKDDMMRVNAQFATNAGLYVTSYRSSKPSVASIDSSGWITAHKEGKTKITVKTNGKKSVSITIKVVDPWKPKGISITSGKKITICIRETKRLYTKLNPTTARANLTWSSSKPSVVSVTSSGQIKGLRAGKATITVRTHNGKKARIKVTVDGLAINPNVHYRALLIGEAEFPGTGLRSMPSRKSVSMLQNALNSVRGSQGNRWSVTTRINRTKDQIYNDIQTAFSGATSNDVSLFFICTHGNDHLTYYQDYFNAGCLSTYPTSSGRALSLHRLAGWLNNVPGKVIVIIDSCGSGAAVYNSKGGEGTYDPATFDQQVVDAFRDLDQGVLAPYDDDQGAFVLSNKFYVLTASAYRETSWHLIGKYHLFVKWLCDGIKTKGRMPADKNKNRFLTLNELYRYVAKKGLKQPKKYRQHVQVYPANSGFELFYRR